MADNVHTVCISQITYPLDRFSMFFADASHFPPPPLSNFAPHIEGDEEEEEEEEEREVSGLGEA